MTTEKQIIDLLENPTLKLENNKADFLATLSQSPSNNLADSLTAMLQPPKLPKLGVEVSPQTLPEINTTAKAILDKALAAALVTPPGAEHNLIDFTCSNLTCSSSNEQNPETTYSDADMAKEMTEFTKEAILIATQDSMLAEASYADQGVLQLLL